MFTCPNCQARTIRLNAKIQSSLFSPIECSKCGALFVISRSTTLMVLFVGQLVAFLAFQYLGSGSIILLVELVLAVFAVGVLYTFTLAPLERISQAVPVPIMRRTTYILLGAFIAALALVPIYMFLRA